VSKIIVCPGNCGCCNLKSECPLSGMMDQSLSADNLAKAIAESLRPQMEQIYIEKISPESIVRAFESELFHLAQSLELIEGTGGEKMTRSLVEEKIRKLIPAIEWGERNPTIKKKYSNAIRIIAIRIMQIKKRLCANKGSQCKACYMSGACLQEVE
jgi:hypothetical protein